ncbi:hypothetical protein P3W45_001089 [Vairimorpha bombi]|jgi:activator of HSP90 ATPase
MNADERMKNYHWTESNISDWARENIEKELIKRGYQIVKLDIFVKICSRMNTLGLVYSINIDANRDNKACFLDNFTSTSQENEGLKDFPWFVDFFKELEGQAILKFSKNVIDLENKEERSFVGVQNIKAEEKKYREFKYESLVNCQNDEFINFLIKKEFIQCWARGVKFEGSDAVIDQIRLSDLQREDNKVKLKFKIESWSDYSDVTVSFIDIRGNTKIELVQKNVPIKDFDVMKGFWKEKIFMPICTCFGFCERPFIDE